MNVISVVKPLHIAAILKHMRKHTLERNPMSVISVAMSMQVVVVFEIMKNIIILRNLMNVISVLKRLRLFHHLQIYERNHTERTSECIQCGKSFTSHSYSVW